MENFKYSNYSRKVSRDLSCYTCGIEKCEKGHSYGPTVRSGYMLYFILEGEGTYEFHKDIYNLHSEEGFLIIPNNLIRFSASMSNPWTYLWIGLTGRQVSNYFQNTSINEEYPIFKFKLGDEIYKLAMEVINNYQCYPQNNLKVITKLYNFLDGFCTRYPCLKKSSIHNDNEDILECAIFIINNNYCNDQLSIDSISDQLHINRSCLYRIFKARLGKSPQQYLIQYRIDRAKDLIENKDLPFNVIASSVGYKDPLSFSREFKHKVGVSPSDYRKLFDESSQFIENR